MTSHPGPNGFVNPAFHTGYGDPRHAPGTGPPAFSGYPPQHPSQYPPQHPSQYPPQHPSQYPPQYPPQHPSQYPPQHPPQHRPQHPPQHPSQPQPQHPPQHPSQPQPQHPPQHPSRHPPRQRARGNRVGPSTAWLRSGKSRSGCSKTAIIVTVVVVILVIVVALAAALGVLFANNADSPVETHLYRGSLRITSQFYTPDLANSGSTGFRELATEVEGGLDAKYQASDLADTYNSSTVTGFSSGSVMVEYVSRFVSTTAPSESSVGDVVSGETTFGNLLVDSASTVSSALEDCSSNQHQCVFDGSCIDRDLVCNEMADCPLWLGQADDELNCGCFSWQFECDDGSCIFAEWQCDGTHDCSSGSDEFGCDLTCAQDEYACSDGTCIFGFWECDGYDDCADGMDESNCASLSKFLVQSL
ncbi:uncharacterized protein LOC144867741 [Branchiostoma floridae x Branchiostoma japonicum]